MMFRGSCIVLLLFLASACDVNSPSPSAPSTLSAAPTPAVPPFRLSGAVFEYTTTGRRPLAGFPFTVTGSGGSFSPLTVDVTSDANGRYEATGFPSGAFITVSLAGYRAPCTLDTFWLSGNKSAHAQRDRRLKALVRASFDVSNSAHPPGICIQT